ncbi:hypothetical protein VF21_05939 [Pseudogymnoascus sp. 05NY08]|nr:hypothetical protein VF21_05939 [Pseudogymnoascus sp. 05NY08]
MAMILPLLASAAALATLAAAAKADISYPATIEIDLLFPLNKTYNANYTSPPLILSIQNVQAAYAYEWSIHWAYYFGDVGIVPMRNKVLVRFTKGEFRLEWDYATTPCIPEGKNAVWQTRTPVASGTSYFSIVEDGSGVDFDLPVAGEGDDACPAFGDSWGVEKKKGCPAAGKAGSAKAGGEPCKARLTERGQVDCIWDFLSTGKNETETCLRAFERVDPGWDMYYTPGSGTKGNSSEGDGGGDSSSSGGTDSSSSGTDTGTGTGTGGSNGDSKEDVGASQRPALSGLALGVFGAVVVVMAL